MSYPAIVFADEAGETFEATIGMMAPALEEPGYIARLDFTSDAPTLDVELLGTSTNPWGMIVLDVRTWDNEADPPGPRGEPYQVELEDVASIYIY